MKKKKSKLMQHKFSNVSAPLVGAFMLLLNYVEERIIFLLFEASTGTDTCISDFVAIM